MAIAFVRPQIISRSKGRSAVACAAYRAGETLKDERHDKIQDYSHRSGVLAQGLMLPANAPDWMRDREKLWNAVERREDRSTRPDEAQLAREMMIALPHELDDKAREYLVKNILKEGATRKGMIADYAIHEPDKEGDDRNYHAHVMLTMRRIDPNDRDGFGNKAREWNGKQELVAFKNVVERETNKMLERNGIQKQITFVLEEGHESQRHMGENATALERRGQKTEVGKSNRAIAERNQALSAARAELTYTRREIALEQARTWEPEAERLTGRFKALTPAEERAAFIARCAGVTLERQEQERRELQKRKAENVAVLDTGLDHKADMRRRMDALSQEERDRLKARRDGHSGAILYDRADMANQQRDALRHKDDAKRQAEQRRKEEEHKRLREETRKRQEQKAREKQSERQRKQRENIEIKQYFERLRAGVADPERDRAARLILTPRQMERAKREVFLTAKQREELSRRDQEREERRRTQRKTPGRDSARIETGNKEIRDRARERQNVVADFQALMKESERQYKEQERRAGRDRIRER